MPNSTSKPLLSIFFVFRNCEDEVESYLAPFLSDSSLPCEILIVNDASTDSTGTTTTSLIEHYKHEHTFYFEHDTKIGVGQSLNELLQQMNTNLFLIIDRPGTPIVSALKESIEKLNGSPDLAIIPDKSNILNPTLLKELLEKKQFPSSTQIIVQKNKVSGSKLFFNPFIETGHSIELILRNGERPGIMRSKIFFKTADEDVALSLSTIDSKTIAFHTGILVDKKLLPDTPESAASFRSSTHVHTGELISDVYERLLILKNEGHYAEALDLVDLILQANPDLLEVEDIKIFLLERLNQYVKASELKHARKRKNITPQQISRSPQLPDPSLGDKKTKVQKSKDKISEDDEEKNKSTEEQSDILDSVDEALKIESGFDFGEDSADGNTENESAKPEGTKKHPKLDHFDISVIIPVTGNAQPLLEKCLIQLAENEDFNKTELIIIDNACLDDTYHYLNQLRENNFFNIKIVKNIRNAGFAQAVNQGIDRAAGKFLCIMHNDVLLDDSSISKLTKILESDDTIGLIGPMTDNCMNPDQIFDKNNSTTEIEEINYLDSFLIVMPKSLAIKFDTRFGQAWYDDIDFCWQIQDSGKKTCVAKGLKVNHVLSATTEFVGHGFASETYHNNYLKFREKWDYLPQIEPLDNPIEELILIGSTINVYHPEPNMVQRINEILTAEVKTQISQNIPEGKELEALIRLMMASEQRDLLRRLEEAMKLPANETLVYELIDFYYNRSIYSRCKKYLDSLKNKNTPFAQLYTLRIAFGEKDLDLTAQLFNELVQKMPANAELYHIAAKLQELEGQSESAEEFRTMAEQLDPFRYAP